MLLFFSIFAIILIIIIFSEVRINIANFQYSNLKIENQKKPIIKISLYFLGKIKLLSFKLKKYETKLDNKSILNILKNRNTKQTRKKLSTKILKKCKINKLNLELFIDTENVLLTSYLVGISSIIISNLLKKYIKKYKKENYKYKILPVYKNKNFIYLNFNVILSIKIVHIIKVFLYISKKNIKERKVCYGFNNKSNVKV